MPQPAFAAAPQGVWIIEGGVAAIELLPCGDQLCGRIVGLQNPVDAAGNARRDRYNPIAAKREALMCGLVVMQGFVPAGAGSWEGGSIYNPLDGQTYSGSLTVLSDNALRVRAYLGTPLFGRSQTWTRTRAPGIGGMQTCPYFVAGSENR
jgi:uncharacterized protein (DUF2147 family)